MMVTTKNNVTELALLKEKLVFFLYTLYRAVVYSNLHTQYTGIADISKWFPEEYFK